MSGLWGRLGNVFLCTMALGLGIPLPTFSCLVGLKQSSAFSLFWFCLCGTADCTGLFMCEVLLFVLLFLFICGASVNEFFGSWGRATAGLVVLFLAEF